MARAFINGVTRNVALNRGVNRVAIGSNAFAAGITFGADTFRIADLGPYSLELLFQMVGSGQDVRFQLQLYNDTTGVVEQQVEAIAPNTGRPELVEHIFNFTVVNVLHDYVIRMNILEGANTSAAFLIGTTAAPTYQGQLSLFLGGGTVAGTVNTVGKFTAPNVIGDSNITDDGTLVTVGSAAVVTGDLTVQGNIVAIDTQHVLVEDNFIYENNGYTTAVARPGGLAVNYLPTAVVDTVAAGGFTAGVPAVSNPTVATTGAATYAPGDLIQISGATNPENNGLFEVVSHAANVLTVAGVGIVPATEVFTQTQFVTDATVAGAITQVNVSVMRAGTDGIWESAAGAATGFAFVDVLSGAGTNNTLPKFTGAGTLADSRISDDATTVQLTPEFRERIGAAPAAFAAAAGAGADVYLRTQDAFPTSAAKGGDLIITVGAGDGVGRNGSVSVPGAGAGSEIFGLGSASAGANSVAIGAGALGGGARAVVVGQGIGATGITGADNVIVGQGNAATLTTGQQNTWVGNVVVEAANNVTNSVALGYGTHITSNSVVVGALSAVNMTGDGNTVVGEAAGGTVVAGTNNVLLGMGADVAAAATTESVAVGTAANVAVNGVTVGSAAAALVTGTNNTVVGQGAAVTLAAGTNNVVVGTAADTAAATVNGVAVGATAVLAADNAVAIGQGSSTTAALSVAVGQGAICGGANGVVVGAGAAATMTGTDNIVIGQGAAVSLAAGTDNIVIGQSSDAAAAITDSVTVGTAAGAGHSNVVVLGSGAVSSASNQLVVGSAAHIISDLYFGEGTAAATADTDGQDVRVYCQTGGAHAAANPRGADWVWNMAEHGAGGTGRVGRMEWVQGDDETIGVKFRTFHNSGSPAASDYVFSWDFTANDSGATQRIIAQMQVKYDDPTAASQDSSWEFKTQNAVNAGDFNTTATLTNAGVWTDAPCFARLKSYEDEEETFISRIPKMKIGRWHLIRQEDRPDREREKHVTPTVEDLFDLFGIGQDPRSQDYHGGIAAIDVGGIALAGVQELIEENAKLRERVEALEKAAA